MSQWHYQPYGQAWGGHKGGQYFYPNPQHRPQKRPTQASKRYDNKSHLLFTKLLQKLDPEGAQDTKDGPKVDQWTCHECGTGHWNTKLARCRFCRASRPKTESAGAPTAGTKKGNSAAVGLTAPKPQPNPPNTSKFAPLASDKAFLATVEALGLVQQQEAESMVVDTGVSTVHAGTVEELTKAQEAHTLVASQFGAESAMANVLQEQVDALQKMHTPSS